MTVFVAPGAASEASSRREAGGEQIPIGLFFRNPNPPPSSALSNPASRRARSCASRRSSVRSGGAS